VIEILSNMRFQTRKPVAGSKPEYADYISREEILMESGPKQRIQG